MSNIQIDYAKVAARITKDFAYFCKVCLTLPARDWTKKPQESEIINKPFVLAEHQLKFVEYLERKDLPDKVILKTRQRGYSTVILAYCMWKILYGVNENVIYAIDRGDKATAMASLMRRLFDSIPDIFKPRGVEWRTQPNRMINRTRNNHLLLKTAVSDIGRSGSFTMVVCDEYAFYEDLIQDEISASLTSSCPKNRIWISTPKKEDDAYHRKVMEAEQNGYLWKHDYYDYISDWFGSKEIADLWRSHQEKGLTPAQIARELDCKFKGAADDLIWYIEPTMFRPMHVRKNQRVVVALDLGWSDETAILFCVDHGQMLHIFDEAIVNQTTTPEVAGIIKNRGYLLKYGVMDSSGKKVDQTSGVSTWKKMQRMLGCKFFTRKIPDKIEMLRIANTAVLEGRVFVDADGCPQLVKMLTNYQWKDDKIPHDKYSHIHDALVYLIYNWYRRPTGSVKPKLENRSKYGIYI